MAMSIQDYEYHRQMQMMARQNGFGGIAEALGFGAATGAGYHGMSAQQAAAAPPPKPDPQTNPVLLLTGDDQ